MKKRILIIDDERDIREVAAASLELVGGFTILQEASGAEGLTTARRERPDAILLDLMMPEMDGYTTLRRMKSDADVGGIPVILLTAKAQGFGTAPEHSGAVGVLLKPFDPMLLPSQIRSLLGWSDSETSGS